MYRQYRLLIHLSYKFINTVVYIAVGSWSFLCWKLIPIYVNATPVVVPYEHLTSSNKELPLNWNTDASYSIFLQGCCKNVGPYNFKRPNQTRFPFLVPSERTVWNDVLVLLRTAYDTKWVRHLAHRPGLTELFCRAADVATRTGRFMHMLNVRMQICQLLSSSICISMSCGVHVCKLFLNGLTVKNSVQGCAPVIAASRKPQEENKTCCRNTIDI